MKPASILLLAVIIALSGLLLAQEPQPPPTFKSSTSLVLVRFHVNRQNHFATDITRNDVILIEDGVERPVDVFEGGRGTGRAIPIEMAIAVDISGSVADQGLTDPVAYISTLLEGLPGVSLGVYGFARDAHRYCGFTRDPTVLRAAFAELRKARDDPKSGPVRVPTVLPKGRSSTSGASWIYESVLAIAQDASTSPGTATRPIVVFSDGQTTTTTRAADVVPGLLAQGVSIYPVALGHRQLIEEMRAVQEGNYDAAGQLSQNARTRMYRLEDREREVKELASLGPLTGGRPFDPPNLAPDTVRAILAMLTATVASEYVVGFAAAPSTGTARVHKLEVKLRSKETGAVMGGKRAIAY
jgi:VWFA-related protein